MDFNTSRANHHDRNQFQTSAASKKKRSCDCDELFNIKKNIDLNNIQDKSLDILDILLQILQNKKPLKR